MLAEQVPTFADLQSATTNVDRLHILEQAEWSFGHQLIQSGNWEAVNHYITILRYLPPENLESYLHTPAKSAPGFVESLLVPEVTPAVVFNLLQGFNISDDQIKRFARITSSMKEDVLDFITQLDSPLNTLKQCRDDKTSLGKFFRTSRNSLIFFVDDFSNTATSLTRISEKISEIESIPTEPEHDKTNKIEQLITDMGSQLGLLTPLEYVEVMFRTQKNPPETPAISPEKPAPCDAREANHPVQCKEPPVLCNEQPIQDKPATSISNYVIAGLICLGVAVVYKKLTGEIIPGKGL